MKALHFVILLCVLVFPLRAFAAAPDLSALLFVRRQRPRQPTAGSSLSSCVRD